MTEWRPPPPALLLNANNDRLETNSRARIARARIARARRKKLMTQWQPIETAPKDGTRIVIWNKRYGFCPIASWHNSESNDDADGWSFDDWNSPCGSVADGFIGWNEDIETGFMPTHWMPLPEPPRHTEDESDHPV